MKTPTELEWQAEIVAALKALGYRAFCDKHYDRENALVGIEFIEFIKETQADLLERHTEQALIEQLSRALNRPDLHTHDGSKLELPSALDVWRHGFDLGNDRVRIAYWRPRDRRDKALQAKYEANRFAVISELHYENQAGAKGNRLDLALFLNGIPIITVELKNQPTNQGVLQGVAQYRKDRSPSAAIFNFPTRAITHFVVDRENVLLTTQLKGDDTYFLPYNRGKGGGRGNPPLVTSAGEDSSTAYLWRSFEELENGDRPARTLPAAWSKDRLLDVLQSYATLQPAQLTDEQKETLPAHTKAMHATLIFPRYHQQDAVSSILDHIVAEGAGHKYLVQHSTGSGKSYTMAWLAQQLAGLHRNEGTEKVFGTVLLVTDRIQLDQQLRELVVSVSGHENIYVAERTSDLAKHLGDRSAVNLATRIITTTLHKFFHLKPSDLKAGLHSNTAIIIDEAHSSQGGALQASMAQALNTLAGKGPAKLSYFAFTATPRAKTLELFGQGPKGARRPFHTYGMRQAREEGFIVDVLRNMRFYQANATLETDAPDKRVTGGLERVAAEKLQIITKKAERILDDIEEQRLLERLGGDAKIMVLAPSIKAGVRYFRTLKALIKARGLTAADGSPVGVLVAFTGHINDPDPAPGATLAKLKEETLNDDGASGLAIAEKLRTSHHILVVVNKFQTGFNEPRLMAMYIDKPVGEHNAVQTLSRLNRPYKQYKRADADGFPRVVDFINTPNDIIEAFVGAENGQLPAYRFLTEQFVEDLFSALNKVLSVDHLAEYIAIKAAYAASHAEAKAAGDPADSGPFAHFFAQRLATYKALSTDDRYAAKRDLARYLSVWPLATLLLAEAYPPDRERRLQRERYRWLVRDFYRYVSKSELEEKGTPLTDDDFEIASAVELTTKLANDVDWADHLSGPQIPEPPDDPDAPEPMAYTKPTRPSRLAQPLQALIDVFHAKRGITPDDRQQGNTEAVFLDVETRVHNGLAMAAQQNSVTKYTGLYRTAWLRATLKRARVANSDLERDLLKDVSRAPAQMVNALAQLSYDRHLESQEPA